MCYVFGQMQDAAAIPALAGVLGNTSQHPMVRHEAAEALGAIAAADCTPLLQRFRSDPEVIVAESCDIALDILDFETSGEFQYADIPLPLPTSAQHGAQSVAELVETGRLPVN